MRNTETDGNRAAVREKIQQSVNAAEIRKIEGWEGLKAFAAQFYVDRVEIDSVECGDRKWSSRGIVTVHLYNWDDEQFGEIRLHLIASGHNDESEVRIDDLVIAPHMH